MKTLSDYLNEFDSFYFLYIDELQVQTLKSRAFLTCVSQKADRNERARDWDEKKKKKKKIQIASQTETDRPKSV